jgi:hypothetical protein
MEHQEQLILHSCSVLFTAFIIIIVLIFLLVSISQKASIATTIILVGIPLVIRYIFYKLANL